MATAKKAVKKTATPARKPPSKKAPLRKTTVARASRPALPAPVPQVLPPTGIAVSPSTFEKPKKPKLVRDSFTIPKAEFSVLDSLKERAARAGVSVKKSEILRAGIKALAAMGDTGFLSALGAVPAIKTGRPAKG